jgi:signal transduction histidine kinase
VNKTNSQLLKKRKENDEFFISFEDNGIGIPDDIQSKLFDPFFTTKDQGQGTGLGLGIVKGIIDKHKGKISVQSLPGSTTFKISLLINKNRLIN